MIRRAHGTVRPRLMLADGVVAGPIYGHEPHSPVLGPARHRLVYGSTNR